jgi:molecular chaperone IbpA
VKVASATLQNGLLMIELQREVPEALKPRRIEIQSEGASARAARVEPRQIESPKAA